MKKIYLLLCGLLVISSALSESKKDPSSDEPWNWNTKDLPKIEVEIEEIPGNVAEEKSARSPQELIEPRFVGKLKKKLCSMGIGCREKYMEYTEIGHAIHPQDINYVQPLVIKPVGKPVPAISAHQKKQIYPPIHSIPIGAFHGPQSHFSSHSFNGHGHSNHFSNVKPTKYGHQQQKPLVADIVFEPDRPHSKAHPFPKLTHKPNRPVIADIVFEPHHNPKGSSSFNLGRPQNTKTTLKKYPNVYGPPAGPPHPSDILVSADKFPVRNLPSTNFDVTHLPSETQSTDSYLTASGKEDFHNRDNSYYIPESANQNVVKHIHIHQHIHQVNNVPSSDFVSKFIQQHPQSSVVDNSYIMTSLGGKTSMKRDTQTSKFPSKIPSFVKTFSKTCTCVLEKNCPRENQVVLLTDQLTSSTAHDPRNSVVRKVLPNLKEEVVVGRPLREEIVDTSELELEERNSTITRPKREVNFGASEGWIPSKLQESNMVQLAPCYVHSRIKRDTDEKKPDIYPPKKEKGPGQTSSRLLNSGVDGFGNGFGGGFGGGFGALKKLKSAIAPSVGVHLGSLPNQGGNHQFYGAPLGGHDNPFQLDLGPFSLNPFAGLKVTLFNGKPVITPSLDLLVTKNKHKEQYEEQYIEPYHSAYSPNVQYVQTHQPSVPYYPARQYGHQAGAAHYTEHAESEHYAPQYQQQHYIEHPRNHETNHFYPSAPAQSIEYDNSVRFQKPSNHYIPTDYAYTFQHKPPVVIHHHTHHHNNGGYYGRANSNEVLSNSHTKKPQKNIKDFQLDRDNLFASQSDITRQGKSVNFPLA